MLHRYTATPATPATATPRGLGCYRMKISDETQLEETQLQEARSKTVEKANK